MSKVLEIMRRWIGLKWPDPRFREIVEPYWQIGSGSTCIVVVTGALAAAGVPRELLNRSHNWIPGDHLRALIDYSRKVGAFYPTHNPADLKSGDLYFLDRGSTGADHMGVVEVPLQENRLITVDGGQGYEDSQRIDRVFRTVKDGLITPRGGQGRRLGWKIDTAKLLRSLDIEDSGYPPKGKAMDTEAIKGYLKQVENDWAATQAAVAKQETDSITKQVPPLPFSRADFLRDRYAWRAWYLDMLDDWYLDDDVRFAGREWHNKQKAYADMLWKPPPVTTQLPPIEEEGKKPGGGGGTALLIIAGLVVGGVIYTTSGKKGK